MRRSVFGVVTIRSIVCSSAARNSAPSPCRRPSYQSRVSTASASACGRNLTRRLTRDPVAPAALHPTARQNLGPQGVPSIADRVQRPPRGSAPVRPGVRRQKGCPKEPSRVRLARPGEVSRAQKTNETTYYESSHRTRNSATSSLLMLRSIGEVSVTRRMPERRVSLSDAVLRAHAGRRHRAIGGQEACGCPVDSLRRAPRELYYRIAP